MLIQVLEIKKSEPKATQTSELMTRLIKLVMLRRIL
jgi:hypothetical protein